MSSGPTGVASTASYVFMYLILKNTLNVESKMAPFIALAASSAGATKSVYGTDPPSTGTDPTRWPKPSPTEPRKNRGAASRAGREPRAEVKEGGGEPGGEDQPRRAVDDDIALEQPGRTAADSGPDPQRGADGGR